MRRVLVHDFQKVKAGDLLVEIVDDDYRAQVARPREMSWPQQASLRPSASRSCCKALDRTGRGDDRGERRPTSPASSRNRAQQESARKQGSPGPPDRRASHRHEKRTAATLALNRAQLDQQRQQLDVLDSQEKQAQATFAAQQAARDLARINLGYTRIVAPVDGMVGQRQVMWPVLNVGTQVISIVPLPNVCVIANYKETQLTRIRIGQPARVTVDAFPGVVLHGHVDSWSPASGAQFSLLPPDNATGNFTKVVQRIPVKIVLDPDPALDDLLRPGMSVIATIDTRSAPRQWPRIASAARYRLG